MAFMENLVVAWKLILAIILYTLQHHAFAAVLPDSAAALQPQTDALYAFKDALANPFALESWNDRDPCSGKWQGITCSPNKDSVIKMLLQGAKFLGSIPKEIKRLDFLEGLVIMNTAFTGELPAVIDNLRKLKTLIVSKNPYISGEFPKGVMNLKQIENLDLSWNNLTGTLPGLSNFALQPTLKQWISFLSNLNGGSLSNSLNWTKLIGGSWPLLLLCHGPWMPFLNLCSGNPYNWTLLPPTNPSNSQLPFTFPAPTPAAPLVNLTTFASLMNLTLPPSINIPLPLVFHWPSMNTTDGNIPFPSSFTLPSFNQTTPFPFQAFQSFWQDANASILHLFTVLNGTVPPMFNWVLLLPKLPWFSMPTLPLLNSNITVPFLLAVGELGNETVLPLLHWLWPALNLPTPFTFNWPLQYTNGTFPLIWNMTYNPLNISFPPELKPLNMTWAPFVNLTLPPRSILYPPLINWTWIVPPSSSVNVTLAPPSILFPPLINWTWLIPSSPPLSFVNLTLSPPNIQYPPLINWTVIIPSPPPPSSINFTSSPPSIPHPPLINLTLIFPSTPPSSSINFTSSPPNITNPPLINWTVIVHSPPPPASINFTLSPPSIPYPALINWTWIVLSPPPPSPVNSSLPPPSIAYPPFINWTWIIPSPPPPSQVNSTLPPSSIAYPPYINLTWIVPSPPPPSSVNSTLPPSSITYPPFINLTWIIPSPPPPSSVNYTSPHPSIPYPPPINWTLTVPSSPPPSASNLSSPLAKFPPPPPSRNLSLSVPFSPPPTSWQFPKPGPPTPMFPPLFSLTWPSHMLEMLRESQEVQSFKDLPNLTHLDLSHNTFVGAVPKELETLTRLQYLNLSNNLFFGETPFTLFRSPRIIDLSNNFLSGNLTSAEQFPKSITLNMSGNCLTGVDPSGELAADQKIWIQNNCLDKAAVKCKCVF